MSRIIKIGTRGSDLALWQARFTAEMLRNLGYASELVIIKTQGDEIQHLSFDKMEGKGFFTKEIEAALLDESIDLAVHSHKDLETQMPEGLVLAAVPQRGFVHDLLLIRPEAENPKNTFRLKHNAVVGTSSARRKAQLMHHLPHCTTRDLRGNVPTRIQKLRDGNYDAILLAKAGVARLALDLSEFITVDLDPTVFIPAPAQGALALQVRSNDPLSADLAQLNITNMECVAIERETLRLMAGGCQMPFGAYCTADNGIFTLHAAFAATVDAEVHYANLQGVNGFALAGRMVDVLKSKF